MKTFTPYLKKRHSKDKYGIINVRFTENRINEYFSTKISIPEKSWNKIRKEVRSSYKDSESINKKIEEKLEEVKLLKESETDPTELSNDEKSFLIYFKSHMDSLYRKKQFGNFKKYNTCYNHLLGYCKTINKHDILFSDIDLKWIKDVDEYINIKGVGKNTRNNYLKCCQKLYRVAKDDKYYLTYDDPFKKYSFVNSKVNKQYLSISNLQNLVDAELERNSKIQEIRNRFLTQIYLCGCRVSDLFSIRFKQIFFDGIDSRIDFTQYKTRKKHSVRLGYDLSKYILYYINREAYYDIYYDKKYSYSWHNSERKNHTIPEMLEFRSNLLGYIKQTSINDKKIWDGVTKKLFDEVYLKSLDMIREYSINNPNEFVVPVLNNELFKNVEFNKDLKLNKKQYNYIDSKVAVYNRDLKKLQQYTGNSNINISSHIARHSYANLVLSTGGDVYSVCKNLGHQSLEVTEAYVDTLNKKVVDEASSNAFKVMTKK